MDVFLLVKVTLTNDIGTEAFSFSVLLNFIQTLVDDDVKKSMLICKKVLLKEV